MVVNDLWFLLQKTGLVWTSPYFLRLATTALYKGKRNTYTILRFKQGFDRCLSTIGKSLRFTIPYSKANNKSKSAWWSIHPAPKSLPCTWFSESRILTLGHPHKHCRISLVDEPSSEKSIDSAGQTNIYRSLTTLWFCVNSYRIVGWSNHSLFPKFLSPVGTWSLLIPGPVGYEPTSTLVPLSLILGVTIAPFSNITPL